MSVSSKRPGVHKRHGETAFFAIANFVIFRHSSKGIDSIFGISEFFYVRLYATFQFS